MRQHPWTPTIRQHRHTVDALHRAVIDVGRQRPILPEQSHTLAGKDTGCIRCDSATRQRSDFCDRCRTQIVAGDL